MLMWHILFATLAAFCQTSITGIVYEGKEPVFAAYVFLAQHRSVNTVTDENGFFCMEISDSLKNDTLVVNYLGCQDYKIPLVNLKAPCKISLIPNQNKTTLSEVVVKADASASKEFAACQLNKALIYMTPAANADPLRAIALQAYSTST